MNVSRKRVRSEDNDNGVQLKYFVNQQMVERCDQNLMKGVYAKTLNMMFAGARVQTNKHPIQPSNCDSSNPPVFDTIDDKLPEPRGCKLCWRDVEDFSKMACKNCSLIICSQCKFNCCGCNASLCTNCVKIFGCKVNDDPICEDCSFYVR